MKASVLVFIFIFASISSLCSADEIYRWVDEVGRVHYGTAPPNKLVKPAELPKINRAEMKLAKKYELTCKAHGGIDCQQGADHDGSVVCQDGFKDAVARFTFHCSEVGLMVSDISELSAEGTLSVFVRNAHSIEADAVEVFIANPSGERHLLLGPATVSAYGIAEFTISAEIAKVFETKPEFSDITISCTNCRS